MDELEDLLLRAASTGARFRADLAERPVAQPTDLEALRMGFGETLPNEPCPPGQVLDELKRAAQPGLVATAGPRYFGFVIGGALPAATAADVLAVGWDQNAFNWALSPAAATAEQVAGSWLKDLLAIPASASVGFVTGGQAANTVGLAAARHHLLAQAGWDVERDGLAGAPPVRIVASIERHATIDRSVRLLGFGTAAIQEVAADSNGAIDLDDLERALNAASDTPPIVCLQAGNVNTGACDNLRAACELVHRHHGWAHVDGAFGLWAAANPSTRHLIDGVELADSWACDGHKWLNVPYDSGFAFCAHPETHAAAVSYTAAYLVGSGTPTTGPADFALESSRRARGFAVWAALRQLGRTGMAELIERNCTLAHRFADSLAQAGATIANQIVLNQVLVGFGDETKTDQLVEAIQNDGTCWMGATTWRGRRLIRISVSNYLTTEADVDRSVAVILRLAGRYRPIPAGIGAGRIGAMTDSHIEREEKFDVGPTFTVPDVSSLLPPGGSVESGTEQLRSRYFDTDDNNLLRAEMTLRRRTGTTDVGWQLKVVHKPAREEIRLPNKSATVPKQLQRLLYGATRGQPLRQVATIATERRVHRLIDVDGALLAEIADDYVEASAGETATIVRFREIEIELGQGDEDLLARLAKRLRKAGAVRATRRSKLARVLSAPASPMAAGLDQHAGAPVMAYLAEQHLVVLGGDLALRRDQDRAIHKTRVAVRRFRSTLRSFSDLFEPESVAGLDAELKWFARLLGEIRDRQVQRSGLNRLIEELPEANVLGPVRSRIDTELRAEQSEAWQRLQTELIGARYLALLDALASWMGDPPLTALAQKSPSKLAGMLAKAERQVHRRLARANESDDVELLHRARKAAKRARYAAELTEPVTGGKAARKLRTRYEQLQDLLGRHQDNVVSAELLHRLGAKAGSVPGEHGFTFGLLYQRVRRDAEDLRVRAARLSRRISGAD